MVWYTFHLKRQLIKFIVYCSLNGVFLSEKLAKKLSLDGVAGGLFFSLVRVGVCGGALPCGAGWSQLCS